MKEAAPRRLRNPAWTDHAGETRWSYVTVHVAPLDVRRSTAVTGLKRTGGPSGVTPSAANRVSVIVSN